VCNYPWDDVSTGRLSTKVPSVSPDDALYRQLCSTYSLAHGDMSRSAKFRDGITNGAAFYSMFGGLQDYAYSQLGMLHITLELGYQKNPPINRLAYDWKANSQAMYALVGQAHFGVRGRVTCSCGGPSTNGSTTLSLGSAGGDEGGTVSSRATMMAARMPRPATDATLSFRPVGVATVPSAAPLTQIIETRTHPDLGSYHRVLLPGTYFVDVKGCGGLLLEGQRVVVPEHPDASTTHAAAEADFNLHQYTCPLETQVKAELHPAAPELGVPQSVVFASGGGGGGGALATAFSGLLACTAPGSLPTLAAAALVLSAACLVVRRQRHRRSASTPYSAVDGDVGAHLSLEE